MGYVYPPLSLFQSQRIWRRQPSIRLPQDIRPLIEAAEINPECLPNNMPEGLQRLYDDLDAIRLRMVGTARSKSPFNSPATDDSREPQTRWFSQHSRPLVLLQKRPEQNGHKFTIHPLNSAPIEIIKGVFSFPLAKALSAAAVTVPAHLVRGLIAPDWLSLHTYDAVYAILPEGQSRLEMPDTQHSPSFIFRYDAYNGLRYERTAKEEATQAFPDEEDDAWF